jgi:23S rRNA (adenine1618-N6)-methyltransferase
MLFLCIELTILSFDFIMCNPPFYSSEDEMLSSAALKQRPPSTACTGSANEMVTPGGEVEFISRIINESLHVMDGVQWYTSMLGKFSSIGPIVEKLKKNRIVNWAVTEFVQGSRTRRWGVAWSFRDMRPPMSLSRGVGSLQKGLLPFPPEYFVTVSGS